jgi:hypothetical protein
MENLREEGEMRKYEESMMGMAHVGELKAVQSTDERIRPKAGLASPKTPDPAARRTTFSRKLPRTCNLWRIFYYGLGQYEH